VGKGRAGGKGKGKLDSSMGKKRGASKREGKRGRNLVLAKEGGRPVVIYGLIAVPDHIEEPFRGWGRSRTIPSGEKNRRGPSKKER